MCTQGGLAKRPNPKHFKEDIAPWLEPNVLKLSGLLKDIIPREQTLHIARLKIQYFLSCLAIIIPQLLEDKNISKLGKIVGFLGFIPEEFVYRPN